MKASTNEKLGLDWRDDLALASHTHPLSQQILRTDVAGMPLEWVDYREAARLYHTDQVAYTCGTLLYRLYGGTWREPECAPSSTSIPSSRRSAYRQSRQSARRGLYAAAQQPDAVPPRCLSVPVLRRAFYLQLVVARSRDAVQPRRHDTWGNVVSACRRCNNAKASRTPEQAGMQLLAVPFTPTYAEYIYLKGRRVLADQMEYLVAHFPRSSPLHERMQRWPM
jgi:5-methylcytosine-specific restriction endonuclease McrA